MPPLDHKQHTLDTPPQSQDFVSVGNVVRTEKDLIVKNYFSVTNTEVSAKIGQKVGRVKITAAASLALNQYYIGCVPTTTITVTLPPVLSAGVGKKYTIKDESGTAATNIITVDGNAAETIDGAATSLINTNYGSITLVASDAAWFII